MSRMHSLQQTGGNIRSSTTSQVSDGSFHMPYRDVSPFPPQPTEAEVQLTDFDLLKEANSFPPLKRIRTNNVDKRGVLGGNQEELNNSFVTDHCNSRLKHEGRVDELPSTDSSSLTTEAATELPASSHGSDDRLIHYIPGFAPAGAAFVNPPCWMSTKGAVASFSPLCAGLPCPPVLDLKEVATYCPLISHLPFASAKATASTVAKLEEEERQLCRELEAAERKIYELEGDHLAITAAYGSVLKGWDGARQLMKHKTDCPNAGTYARIKQRMHEKKVFSYGEREFSLSSITSPIASPMDVSSNAMNMFKPPPKLDKSDDKKLATCRMECTLQRVGGNPNSADASVERMRVKEERTELKTLSATHRYI
eukprot:GHVS01106763.1.p1 GENE.GHVS01106763.1~~GHVS01106763.1.p1  ORF type:complete len:367 (+),score=43.83 GHVS01106763.1:103-1203(+)